MDLAEHTGEAGEVFEAGQGGNFEDRVVGVEEEILGIAHAGADDVGFGRHACYFGEKAAEVGDADRAGGSKVFL